MARKCTTPRKVRTASSNRVCHGDDDYDDDFDDDDYDDVDDDVDDDEVVV